MISLSSCLLLMLLNVPRFVLSADASSGGEGTSSTSSVPESSTSYSANGQCYSGSGLRITCPKDNGLSFGQLVGIVVGVCIFAAVVIAPIFVCRIDGRIGTGQRGAAVTSPRTHHAEPTGREPSAVSSDPGVAGSGGRFQQDLERDGAHEFVDNESTAPLMGEQRPGTWAGKARTWEYERSIEESRQV